MVTKGLFPGLDSVKREIGFLAASLFYVFLGPDRWDGWLLSLVRSKKLSDYKTKDTSSVKLP